MILIDIIRCIRHDWGLDIRNHNIFLGVHKWEMRKMKSVVTIILEYEEARQKMGELLDNMEILHAYNSENPTGYTALDIKNAWYPIISREDLLMILDILETEYPTCEGEKIEPFIDALRQATMHPEDSERGSQWWILSQWQTRFILQRSAPGRHRIETAPVRNEQALRELLDEMDIEYRDDLCPRQAVTELYRIRSGRVRRFIHRILDITELPTNAQYDTTIEEEIIRRLGVD